MCGGHSAETWLWWFLVLQHLEALYESESVSCCSNVNVSERPGNGHSRLPLSEGPVVSRWQCGLARTPTHNRTILWLLAGEECALACFDLGRLLLSFFPFYVKPPSVNGTLSGCPKMCSGDEPNLIFALWFDLESNEETMEKLFFPLVVFCVVLARHTSSISPRYLNTLIFITLCLYLYLLSLQVLLHRDPRLSYPVSDHTSLRVWLWHVLSRFYRVGICQKQQCLLFWFLMHHI